jgi:hypothetical protein
MKGSPVRSKRDLEPRATSLDRLMHHPAEVACSAMPDAVKGGLFVGAAVATGLLLGLFVPSLVGAERETVKGPRAHKSLLPTMPGVIGQPLDEAQGELRRRGIPYVTDVPDLVEVVVPDILEVCESEPRPGRSVRRSARLHVGLAGTCNI